MCSLGATVDVAPLVPSLTGAPVEVALPANVLSTLPAAVTACV